MDMTAPLQRLRTDNTSGALALADLALDMLAAFVGQETAFQPAAFRKALEAFVGAIIIAQPSMAVLLNLAQQVLQACTGPEATCREQVQGCLAAFRHELHTSLQRLCQQALPLFPPQATVLTYSNSATVIAALGYAQAQQGVCRVLLSESRPAYDGRQQALALLQQGMQVEFSVDMALCERLPEVDLVLVGADAVFPHGLVNKLGTHTLAQLARLHQVPCYSLCTAHKFLPQQAWALFRIVEHPDDEVWPQPPAELIIRNTYFDRTPLELFSGIVHEAGISTPEAVSRLLQACTLAPALQRLILPQA
jgi:translation initiation factor 2B subunit (eIF-2B alpha/beta/delta family)